MRPGALARRQGIRVNGNPDGQHLVLRLMSGRGVGAPRAHAAALPAVSPVDDAHPLTRDAAGVLLAAPSAPRTRGNRDLSSNLARCPVTNGAHTSVTPVGHADGSPVALSPTWRTPQ